MRFTPNDSLICIQAPWHEPGAPGCAFAGYGPKVNEVVEVDYYIPHKRSQIVFKQYPSLEPPNHFGFNEKFFQRVMSQENLYSEINEALQTR